MSNAKKKLTLLLGLMLAVSATFNPTASAIEIDGSGDRVGIQALYLFKDYNPTTGIVPDVSGVGSPLNLTVDNRSNVSLHTTFDPISGGNVTGLRIGVASAIKQTVDNPKIISACAASDEITIDMWVRNLSEEPVGRPQPVRIVTLARKLATNVNNRPDHENAFYIGQFYDNAGAYEAGIRAGGQNRTYRTPDQKGLLMFGTQMPPQRVVFTKNRDGVARLWISNAAGILQRQAEMTGAGSIGNWDDNAATAAALRLSIGNEPNYADFPEYVGGQPGDEWKSWLGTIYTLAVFCRAFEPTDLLGERAPGSSVLPIYPVDPNDIITPARRRAHMIYKRITSINTPIDNPVVKSMATLIEGGDVVGAARLATQETPFYNITVRDMAARMSTRELTVNTPLNDMVATFIGVTRDDIDARQLLTGNFTYRANPLLAAVPMDEVNDFLKSNNHYEALENGRFDLARVLVRVDGQKLYNGATGAVVLNPDPAGVLTSRAFLSAHAIAGTNRRAVEFAFKEFLCIDINKWADVTATDTFVGRDVDRAPGAEHNTYKTTCRACHAVMDGFRGAFAKVDFASGYVKHGDVMFGLTGNANQADVEGLMYQNPPGISGKMNRNADQFPGGYAINDTYWQNNADRGLNKEYFGWPAVPNGQSTHKGYGIKSFATLISQAQAFPRCMATRAYRAVCKRDPTANEQALINRVASEFQGNGYRIRELFARIAPDPSCLGQ